MNNYLLNNSKTMKLIEKRYWHYTPAIRLPQIIKSGKIKLDEQARSYGEKPAAWISTNPIWENTATKPYADKSGHMVERTNEEMSQELGLGRIEVKASNAFISWLRYRNTSGINPRLWSEMTKYGTKIGGDPNEWYASYIPIMSRYFISVEMFIKGEWIRCDDWNQIDQFLASGMKANMGFFKRKSLGRITSAA